VEEEEEEGEEEVEVEEVVEVEVWPLVVPRWNSVFRLPAETRTHNKTPAEEHVGVASTPSHTPTPTYSYHC